MLLERIKSDVMMFDIYFMQKVVSISCSLHYIPYGKLTPVLPHGKFQDCTGLLGLSTKQKMNSALQLLDYGVAHNTTDEYNFLAKATTQKSLDQSLSAINKIYVKKYLQAPNKAKLKPILVENSILAPQATSGASISLIWHGRTSQFLLLGSTRARVNIQKLF